MTLPVDGIKLHRGNFAAIGQQIQPLLDAGQCLRLQVKPWREKRSLSQNALSHMRRKRPSNRKGKWEGDRRLHSSRLAPSSRWEGGEWRKSRQWRQLAPSRANSFRGRKCVRWKCASTSWERRRSSRLGC